MELFNTGPVLFRPEYKLLALSWKQPYAELMMYGKIETRTWKTNFRGWVMICASKKEYDFKSVISISGFDQANRVTQYSKGYIGSAESWVWGFPNGMAVGIARLVDCRPMRPQDEEKCFVQFRSDLYCHVYDDVSRIEPFPWTGSQGWKEVPESIKRHIKIISDCESCGGDGIETCNNPDHGWIQAVGGELNRLGCPCCGHDPNFKMKGPCPDCNGTGKTIIQV